MSEDTTVPTIDVRKYGGKQVAIVAGEIVASGTDTAEILQAVQSKMPQATWRDVLLVSVPEALTVVYCL
jgi:hypothetical protein